MSFKNNAGTRTIGLYCVKTRLHFSWQEPSLRAPAAGCVDTARSLQKFWSKRHERLQIKRQRHHVEPPPQVGLPGTSRKIEDMEQQIIEICINTERLGCAYQIKHNHFKTLWLARLHVCSSTCAAVPMTLALQSLTDSRNYSKNFTQTINHLAPCTGVHLDGRLDVWTTHIASTTKDIDEATMDSGRTLHLETHGLIMSLVLHHSQG